MRIQPLIYHFEYQRKGNTRKSIKGRFAQSDAIKKHWSKYDNISSYENPHRKDTRNEVLGFRRFARKLSKINTATETINSKDYVMPTYRNNFIKIESFIPRNSNRVKYKMKKPRYVLKELEDYDKKISTKVKVVKYTDKKGYIQTKIIKGTKDYRKIPILEEADFNTLKIRKNILEKRFVKIQKERYEEYFKTNKYN